MTDEEFWAARQLLAEETAGRLVRANQRAEQDAVDETVAAIRRTQGISGHVAQSNTPAVIPPRPITDEVIG